MRLPFKPGLAKELFLLAYPVSLGQVSYVMTNIADTIMLGQYDSSHLAASTFAFNVFLPFLIFSMGFSMGITPFISQENAKKNAEEIKKYSSNGLFVAIGLTALIVALGFLITYFLGEMQQPKELVVLAKPYYSLLIFSLIPLISANLFKQVAEGLAHTKPTMVISFVSNGLNIILNYLFIYGKLGFEPMGIEGAGIATLIARCSLVVLSIAYILAKPAFRQALWNNPFVRLSKKKIYSIVQVSFPISIQFTLEVAAFAISAIMIGWLGKASLASHQIAISVAATTYLIASGIGSAATIKASELFALNHHQKLIDMGYTAFIMVILFMGTTAVSIYLFKNTIPLLYVRSNEIQIIRLASSLLALAAIFQLSDGIQVVGHGILRGLKDVKIPTYFSMISYWAIGLPIGYYLAIPLEYGVKGFWIGLSIGLTALALLLYTRVRKLITP